MSLRRVGDEDGDTFGESTRPVEHEGSSDPVSLTGLIYRVIGNGWMVVRLCVLLTVVAAVVVGVAKFAPSDVLLAVLDTVVRGRS